jgi:hypothetical protein
MPDIYHSLLGHDLGHLRIIAEAWGMELKANNMDSAAKELSAALLDPEQIADLITSLPLQAREALNVLTTSNGRSPYASFTRQFGNIREMGAGKRDRERPHIKPASTSEILFYRAFIARAFFDTDKGPQEFAYIPDDLFGLIGHRDTESQSKNRKEAARLHDSVAGESLGRGATPGEKNHILPADDRILDDATTQLAALRLGKSDFAKHAEGAQSNLQQNAKLISLLQAAGLVKKNIPQAEAVRKFLEAARTEALQMLVEAWQASETFNELRLMPGIVCEGEWKNSVLDTRNSMLGFLASVPRDTWWSLNAFIHDIKQKRPDFQRPAGDYDSWFIQRTSDGQYLRGFQSWDEVDGALIRFFITDILYWLGSVELASPQDGKEVTAFRISGIGNRESEIGKQGTTPDSRLSNIENAKLKVTSNGKISAPRRVPRAVRYQLSRFCEWEDDGRATAGSRYTPSELLDHPPRTETKPDEYQYRVTPHSLIHAKEQGLKVEQLLALLAKHSDAGIPPVLVKALKRWEANGTEARAETQVILKVGRPEVLEELRKSKAARFLGEPLGPTSVVIKAGAQSKVMAALVEMGLLAEDNTAQAAVPSSDVKPAPRAAQGAKK